MPVGKIRCLFKPNAAANNVKYLRLTINLPIQSLCITAVSLGLFDRMTFLFCMGRKKHADLWEEA